MQLPLLVNMLPLGFSLSPGFFSLLVFVVLLADKRYWSSFGNLDLLVLAYLIFSLSTFLLYLIPTNPVGFFAYVIGINIAVMPMLMYLFGRAVRGGERMIVSEFIVSINATVLLFSIIMQVLRPDFYTEYLATTLESAGATEVWQFYARMQGYLGSTALGILCSMSMLLLLATSYRAIFKFCLASVFLIGAMLTFQRSSMLISILVYAYVLNNITIRQGSRFGGFLILSLVVIILLLSENELIVSVINRLSEILEAFDLSERKSYYLIVPQLNNFPFGMGLGATTSAADTYGYNPGGQIVDANHMRILSDLGPIGLLLFIVLSGYAIVSAYNHGIFVPYGLIVVGYNLQAIGTNVFDSYYTGHLYWFYLGLIGSARFKITPAN
jgi:hypothetical protein